MKHTFPNNIHSVPVAFAYVDGEWECDLQVRTEEGMDIDGFARDRRLDRAYARAFQRVLKSRTMYERVGYVPNKLA